MTHPNEPPDWEQPDWSEPDWSEPDWEGPEADADPEEPQGDDLADPAGDEHDAVACPHCGEEIYADAEQCPACGQWLTRAELARSTQPPWLAVVAVLLAVALVLWLL